MCAGTFKEFLLFSFLFFFKIASANGIPQINVIICNLTTFVARFVAAAFGVVAGADFCCATKLRNKSLVCRQP